ncbi:hypothetical protein QZH41_013701 [Actinostola sp. cb2023]|nr:hypothetical protein QZH41_013701 [Actinostola sp. cb2023]
MSWSAAILVLVLLLGVHHSTSTNMHVNRDKGLIFDFYPAHKLVLPLDMEGIMQHSVRVADKMDCVFACTKVDWCRSVNLKTTPQSNGLFVCEMMSSDQFTSSSNMTSDKAYNHYSVKNPCQKEPCRNGGKCIFQDNRQDYRCNCKQGFQGEHCEKDFKSCRFTNLGTSGRYGPTSIGSHYDGQDHKGQVSVSAGIQTWTVPYTAQYRIEAVGASGGYANQSNTLAYRGRGARMIGTFSFNKGDHIKILVGQEGGIASSSCGSCAGGGGSFVVKSDNTPLIIAGAGAGTECATQRYARSDGSASTSGNQGHGGKEWNGGSGGQGATMADSGNSGRDRPTTYIKYIIALV